MWELLHGEKKQFTAHKHSFLFIIETLFFAFLALLPYLIPSSWISIIPLSFINEESKNIQMILYIIWLIFLWIRFFVSWTNYFLDIWIITDKRIIDIEQKSLFHRDIATVQLEHIVDIRTVSPGFFGSILGYGTLEIQTAGAEKEFTIRNVTRPEEIKQKISSLQRKTLEKVQKVQVVK